MEEPDPNSKVVKKKLQSLTEGTLYRQKRKRFDRQGISYHQTMLLRAFLKTCKHLDEINLAWHGSRTFFLDASPHYHFAFILL